MKELQSQTELVMLDRVVKIGEMQEVHPLSVSIAQTRQLGRSLFCTKEGSPRSFKERCSWWGRNSDTESWEGAEAQIKLVFQCTLACIISYDNQIIFMIHDHLIHLIHRLYFMDIQSVPSSPNSLRRRTCKRRQRKSQCWRKVLQRWKVRYGAVPFFRSRMTLQLGRIRMTDGRQETRSLQFMWFWMMILFVYLCDCVWCNWCKVDILQWFINSAHSSKNISKFDTWNDDEMMTYDDYRMGIRRNYTMVLFLRNVVICRAKGSWRPARRRSKSSTRPARPIWQRQQRRPRPKARQRPRTSLGAFWKPCLKSRAFLTPCFRRTLGCLRCFRASSSFSFCFDVTKPKLWCDVYQTDSLCKFGCFMSFMCQLYVDTSLSLSGLSMHVSNVCLVAEMFFADLFLFGLAAIVQEEKHR